MSSTSTAAALWRSATDIPDVSSAAVEAPTVASKTVIVADDTAFVRDRFKSALERVGHTAISVSSGSELLARVKSNPAYSHPYYWAAFAMIGR